MNAIASTSASDLPPPMALALSANFGSVSGWRDSFTDSARAHAQKPGRLELAFLPDRGTLVTQWAEAASAQQGVPIISLQMPLDDGEPLTHIDWPEAYQHYQHAVHAASESLGVDRVEVGDAPLIDVRRAGVFDAAPTLLPGAVWRDPALVCEWAPELAVDRPVVVYCVYGHEVGRVTALRLCAQGVKARYLSGGIDGWQGAGLPTMAKEKAP